MINIRVDELLKMAKELSEEGYEYVEVSILEADEFEGEIMPATLHFSAFDGKGGGVDFDSIEEVEVSATYKFEEEDEMIQSVLGEIKVLGYEAKDGHFGIATIEKVGKVKASIEIYENDEDDEMWAELVIRVDVVMGDGKTLINSGRTLAVGQVIKTGENTFDTLFEFEINEPTEEVVH